MRLLYITRKMIVIDISYFNETERAVFDKMAEQYKGKPDWIEFKNAWHGELRSLYRDLDGRAFVKKPLYRIYQDLASRLGIEQNEVKATC